MSAEHSHFSDDHLANRLVALTRDLMLIPSTETRPAERARCFQFIGNHLDALDSIAIHQHESGGYTSLVALPNNGQSPDILLCGHLDVIEHPRLDSYASAIKDGRIYGPGSGDMKGQLAIMLDLFRSIHENTPGASLGLAITSDEERGGEHGVRFLFDDVGLRCGITIIPDGGSLTELTIEEKGILQLRASTTGHAAHAARPWLTTNPLQLLTDQLSILHRHFDKLRPDGAIERGDHWFPTCTLTSVATSNTTRNRIPSSAEAILDVRFPPPRTSHTMLAEIRDVMGSGVTVESIVSAEPTHLDPDQLFIDITREITGQPVSLVRASGGSDARFIRLHHIPVNLSRPLVGNLHAEDEWIDIESMLAYHRICKAYIARKLTVASG